jgi:ABC-type glycerol-3-phosphate transport system permease component
MTGMAIDSANSATIGRRQSALGLAGQVVFRPLTYALMILLAVLFLFPFYTMVVGSFMPLNELFSFSPNLLPQHPTFDNYSSLFKQFP